MNRRTTYDRLAHAFALVHPYANGSALTSLTAIETYNRLTRNVANVLAVENRAFDRVKFLNACGVPINSADIVAHDSTPLRRKDREA